MINYERLAGIDDASPEQIREALGGMVRRPKTIVDAARLPPSEAEAIYGQCFTLGPRVIRERPMTNHERRTLEHRYQQIPNAFDPTRQALERAARRGLISARVAPQVAGTDLLPEGAELPNDDDPTHHLASIATGTPESLTQPTVNLEGSGLIAVITTGPTPKIVLDSLRVGLSYEDRGRFHPTTAINFGDGRTAYLLVAETMPSGSARVLRVEVNLDPAAIVKEDIHADFTSRTLALPCAGSVERWENPAAPYPASAQTVELCAPRSEGFSAQLTKWLKDNFVPLPEDAPAKEGIDRGELHALICQANDLDADTFTPRQLADIVSACGWIERRRAATGVKYAIMRKPNEEMTTLKRIRVEDIDPSLWDAFLRFRASLDTPQRRAKRAAEQAERDRLAAIEADRVRRFGHRTQAEINQLVGDHQKREQDRAAAAKYLGRDFAPLDPQGAIADWWDLPYAERLERFLPKDATKGAA
jgi:hypothetical protein